MKHINKALCLTSLLLCFAPLKQARADEGTVPFWISGLYTNMAATPSEPGWNVTVIPYFFDGSISKSKEFPIGVNVAANLDVQKWIGFVQVLHTSELEIFGAHPTLGFGQGLAYNKVSGTIEANADIGSFTHSASDDIAAQTDLYPYADLRWKNNFNNFKFYLMGDVPWGYYKSTSLVSVGIGHAAFDYGGGYTYLNTNTGLEVSGTLGMTYNLENPATKYKNGMDLHLDWGVSQFLNEHINVGIAGYVYNQFTDDSGVALARLGGFRSRVAAIGPSVAYITKLGQRPAYFSVRQYSEFWSVNRPSGYSVMGVFNVPVF